MIVTSDGIPIQFLFTSGHAADISTFRHFNFRGLGGCKIYADGAYSDSQCIKKIYFIFIKLYKKKIQLSRESI